MASKSRHYVTRLCGELVRKEWPLRWAVYKITPITRPLISTLCISSHTRPVIISALYHRVFLFIELSYSPKLLVYLSLLFLILPPHSLPVSSYQPHKFNYRVPVTNTAGHSYTLNEAITIRFVASSLIGNVPVDTMRGSGGGLMSHC